MSPEPGDLRRYRRLLPWAVAFSVLSLALVLATFGLRDDDALHDAVARLDWRVLPAALTLHVAAHLFWSARYALVARGLGTPMAGPGAWAIVTAGVFGGAVTPGRIGGEGLKMALLMRRGTSAAQAGRILLTDRSMDLVFFMALGLSAAALLPPLFGADGAAARGFALLGSGFLALFLVLLVLLLTRPAPTGRLVQRTVGGLARLVRRGTPDLAGRTQRFLDQVREGILGIGRRPGIVGAALALTALNWLAEYGTLWALLRGFGHAVPFWAVFFVGIVLTLVVNIPLTPGGSGVAEVAALALLTPLAPGLSPLFVVAWRSTTYYYDLAVGGTVASAMLPRRAAHLREDLPQTVK